MNQGNQLLQDPRRTSHPVLSLMFCGLPKGKKFAQLLGPEQIDVARLVRDFEI